LFLPTVLAEAAIGAGTVWCAAMLANDMFNGGAAIIAAAITALYPYYVMHDTALQETSLFTFLTAVAVILLLRAYRSGSAGSAAWAGFVLSLDVLTRATIAPFAVLAALWLFARHRRAALLYACVAALVVAPWLIRSYRLTGTPALTTETGLQIWDGNNAYTFSHYPEESIDLSKGVAFDAMSATEQAELNGLGDNEAVRDRWFRRKGIDYIRANPWQTVANGFRKNEAAFGWLLSPRRSFGPNLLHALSYGPVMLLGLWGIWSRRHRWREDSLIYAAFLSFVGVTAVFFGHTSHRAYLDVYWIVFASGVLEALRRKYFRASRATRAGA
jgi:4-amino-4-deoxy-L-arabinose transferase-like glycosyltransferase